MLRHLRAHLREIDNRYLYNLKFNVPLVYTAEHLVWTFSFPEASTIDMSRYRHLLSERESFR